MSTDFEVADEEPWRHKISILFEGKKVSWLTIVDLKMHYGRSEITVGGIAGVYTPKEFGRKGYSRKVLNYAIEWMKPRGYSLSALFGIHGFYDKFDFGVFTGEHTASLTLKDVARIKSPAAKHQIVLSADPTYKLQEIRELYEENNRYRIGSKVRGPKFWKGFRKGVAWEHEPNILVAGDDDVTGYAVLDRWHLAETLAVAEMDAREHDYNVYRSLLNELYHVMTENLNISLTLYVPPDHPLVNLLRASGCKLQCNYPSNDGGMARVISLKGILTEVKAELQRRSHGLEGEVSLCVPGEAATVIVEDGSIELRDGALSANRVEMGCGEAAQMILGYRDPREIVSSVEAHGNLAMLEYIFPKTTPYVWQPDRW